MHGPVWSKHSPKDIVKTTKLEKPPHMSKHQMQSILHPHKWLTSDEVDATCILFTKKFSTVDRFQSCLLLECLHQGGVVGTPEKPFIQILNINNNHWITASTMFSGTNELCLYDSLYVKITKETEQKPSWIICPKTLQFTIRLPAVQKQQSGSNCGLFAPGFCFSFM